MPTESRVPTLDLLLEILRRQWWLILITTLALAALVYLISVNLDERYHASAVLVHQPATYDLGLLGGAAPLLSGRTAIPRDALEVSSLQVASRVSSDLGESSPRSLLADIDVTVDEATESIQVNAESGSAERAAELANAFARAFMEERRQDMVSRLEGARGRIEAQLSALSEEERAGDYAASLAARATELQLLVGMVEPDYGLVEPAVSPPGPFFPRPFLFAFIGGLVGFVAGWTIAWIRTVTDRTLRDSSIVEQQLGIEVLTAVPRLPAQTWRANGSQHIGFAGERAEQFEAHRLLRSKVFLEQRSHGLKTIAITSAAPEEGKTTTSINLGLAIALSGQRVVILEADLRRPSLARYLKISDTPGLYSVLKGDATPDLALQAIEFDGLLPEASVSFLRDRQISQDPDGLWSGRLRVLPAGSAGPDASELLESDRLGEVVTNLCQEFDFVLIDTPPVLAVHDVLTVVEHVSAVILVTRLGKTREEDARRSLELLARTHAPLLGVVTIGAKTNSGYGYYVYHQPEMEMPG